MGVLFETLNGKLRVGQFKERARKSIKEIHLAQGTKTLIFVAWREELGILKQFGLKQVLIHPKRKKKGQVFGYYWERLPFLSPHPSPNISTFEVFLVTVANEYVAGSYLPSINQATIVIIVLNHTKCIKQLVTWLQYFSFQMLIFFFSSSKIDSSHYKVFL